MLGLARLTIRTYLAKGRFPEYEPQGDGLKKNMGAFVSLHEGERLRGCIGVFVSEKPLYRTVMEMGVSAATDDPRFSSVTTEELPRINIEISVISPLEKIKDIVEIEVGRHGLYIVKGKRRGVLLPQVATEFGFDCDTFLDQTCVKAGLMPGDWREGADIYIFEAEVFSE